ncbi:MAG: membrane integrity-associated transporter subunit PqiC [Ramlibacter sp.]|nr:membrane integrity-associated transporter subunit PqiC [Ramlibacter sp.]
MIAVKFANIARLAAVAAVVLVSACATPDKPTRSALFDFGPGATEMDAASTMQASIVLSDIDATSSGDSTTINYRLAYSDGNQLRPYSQARWTAPPPQLIRQRIREQLGRERAVLDLSESAALARAGGVQPRVLRVDLEEFSQVFESPAQSYGLIRLRVTLMENTIAGEKLVAQRAVIARVPASSADAAGGVKALTTATDNAALDIAKWLQTQR